MKQFKFLPVYSPLFYSDKPYIIVSGGRASGKSTNMAAYLLLKLMGDEYARIVIARYTQKSISSSIYQDITDLIMAWGIRNYVRILGDRIENKQNGNLIITHSFKISDLTQQAKGKGISNPNYLFIDEAQEVDDEQEFIKLIDSFRKKGAKRKIILALNPTTKSHWIFKRWFLPDQTPNPKWVNTHDFIHTTYKDNEENLDPEKVAEWEKAKVEDPDYYNHHILGKWLDIGEGQVFKNWKFTYEPDSEAEVLYGLDFGFSSDPSAMVKVSKRGKKLWVEEVIYERGLTNEDLLELMKRAGVPLEATIYADSAEPKSIETLRRLGYRNIRSSRKGPDSINAGIDRVNSYEVFCSPKSKNLIEEYYVYSYKTGTDKPIDSMNHLCDALRYALSHEHPQTAAKYAVIGRPRPSANFM